MRAAGPRELQIDNTLFNMPSNGISSMHESPYLE